MLNPEYDYQMQNVITKCGMWLPSAECDYQVWNVITKKMGASNVESGI